MIKAPSIQELRDNLQTIKNETEPIDGHANPGEIEGCWNKVFDIIESFETLERLFKRMKINKIDAVIEGSGLQEAEG